MMKSAYFVPFFNFFYYNLLVPFKIQYDEKNALYFVTSIRVFKYLCAILHGAGALVMVIFHANYFLTVQIKDPSIVMALDVASSVASLFGIACITHVMWRKQEELVQIVNLTQFNIPSWKVRLLRAVIYTILGVIVTCLSSLNALMIQEGTTVQPKMNEIPSYIQNSTNINDKRTNILNDILEYGFAALIAYYHTLYQLFHGIPVVLALSVKALATEFNLDLEKTITEKDFHTGLRLQRELKRKTDRVRDLFGNILMAYYVSSVCYYAQVPHILLGKRGETEKVYVVYFLLNGVCWIWAADFYQKVKNTRLKWIEAFTDMDKLGIENRLKLISVSVEIMSDPIAISSNYLIVTYSHISSMLGLILAYGIIVFQLHKTD